MSGFELFISVDYVYVALSAMLFSLVAGLCILIVTIVKDRWNPVGLILGVVFTFAGALLLLTSFVELANG